MKRLFPIALIVLTIAACHPCHCPKADAQPPRPVSRPSRVELADALTSMASTPPAESRPVPQMGFKPLAQQADVPNFGLMVDELGKRGFDHYELNGRPIAQGDALQAVKEGLPADQDLLRVTVFGSESQRQRVVADLTRAPAGLRDRFLVQAYPPTHWVANGAGFHVGGDPTVYLQAPDGTVLHRQDDYHDGAEGLYGAIRKADPRYVPGNDPDLRNGSSLEPWQWVIGGVCVVLALAWFRHTNKQPPAGGSPVAAPSQAEINTELLAAIKRLQPASPAAP